MTASKNLFDAGFFSDHFFQVVEVRNERGFVDHAHAAEHGTLLGEAILEVGLDDVRIGAHQLREALGSVDLK